MPIGFIHDSQGKLRLNPDVRIQESVRQLFRIFRRTGSASATVKAMQRLSLAPLASSAGKRAALGLHGSAAQRRDKEQQLHEPLIAGGSLELAE